MTTSEGGRARREDREPFDYDAFLHLVLLGGVLGLFVLAGFRAFAS